MNNPKASEPNQINFSLTNSEPTVFVSHHSSLLLEAYMFDSYRLLLFKN